MAQKKKGVVSSTPKEATSAYTGTKQNIQSKKKHINHL